MKAKKKNYIHFLKNVYFKEGLVLVNQPKSATIKYLMKA